MYAKDAGIIIAELWDTYQSNKQDPIPSIAAYCESEGIKLKRGKELCFVNELSQTTGRGTIQYVSTADFTTLCRDCLDFDNRPKAVPIIPKHNFFEGKIYPKTYRNGLTQ